MGATRVCGFDIVYDLLVVCIIYINDVTLITCICDTVIIYVKDMRTYQMFANDTQGHDLCDWHE